ncbi:MAG: response regulator [Anaerolineae bacterium]|nr:response regulator [Anaerolineae bacterium]
MDYSRWTILVVEDDFDSRQMISKILQHHGIDVSVATDGRECLAMLESITPTLIVTDLAMPRMDGWETLNAIRANSATRHIPVIAITAYDSPATAQGAMMAGFNAYFAKPLDPRTFVQALSQFIAA